MEVVKPFITESTLGDDNDTESYYPFPIGANSAGAATATIYWIMFFLCVSIVGNSLVIASFLRDHRLQVIFNLFVVHLAVADVTLSVLLILTIIDDVTELFALQRSSFLCQLFTVFVNALPVQQLILSHMMCNDRHKALQRWLRYTRHMSRWHSEKIVLSISWGVTILASFLVIDVVRFAGRRSLVMCRLSDRLLYVNFSSALHACLLLGLVLALLSVVCSFRQRRRKRPLSQQLGDFNDDLSPILFYKSHSSLLGSRHSSQTLVPRSPLGACRDWCQIPILISPIPADTAMTSSCYESKKQVTLENLLSVRYSRPRPARKLSPSRQSYRPPRKSPMSLYHYSYEALSPRSRQRVSALDSAHHLHTIEDEDSTDNIGGESRVPDSGPSDVSKSYSTCPKRQNQPLAVGGLTKVTGVPAPRALTPLGLDLPGEGERENEETTRAGIVHAGSESAPAQLKLTVGTQMEKKSVMSKGRHERGKGETRKTVRILQADQQALDKGGYNHIQSLDDLDNRVSRTLQPQEDSYAGSSSLSDDEPIDLPLPRYRPRTDSLYTLRSCLSISEESLSQTTDDMRDLSVYSDESASIDEFELGLRGSRERRKDVKMCTIHDDNEELSDPLSEVNIKGKSESLNTLLSCYNISAAQNSVPTTSLQQVHEQADTGTEKVNMRVRDEAPAQTHKVGDPIDRRCKSRLDNSATETAECFPKAEEDRVSDKISQSAPPSSPKPSGCAGDISARHEGGAEVGNIYKNLETIRLSPKTTIPQGDEDQAITASEPEKLDILSQKVVQITGESADSVDTDTNWSKGESADADYKVVHPAKVVTTLPKSDSKYELDDINIFDARTRESNHLLSTATSSGTVSDFTYADPQFPLEEELRGAVEDWISFYGIQGVRYEDLSHLSSPCSTLTSDTAPCLQNSTVASANPDRNRGLIYPPRTQSVSKGAKHSVCSEIPEIVDPGSQRSDLLRVRDLGVLRNPGTDKLYDDINEVKSEFKARRWVKDSDHVETEVIQQREQGQVLTVPIQVHAAIDSHPSEVMTSSLVRQSRSRWHRPTASFCPGSGRATKYRKDADMESVREKLRMDSLLDKKEETIQETELQRQDDYAAKNVMSTQSTEQKYLRKETGQLSSRDRPQNSSYPGPPVLCKDQESETSKLMIDNKEYPAEGERPRSCPDYLHLGGTYSKPATNQAPGSTPQEIRVPPAMPDTEKDVQFYHSDSLQLSDVSSQRSFSLDQHGEPTKSGRTDAEQVFDTFLSQTAGRRSQTDHMWTSHVQGKIDTGQRGAERLSLEGYAKYSGSSQLSTENTVQRTAGRGEDLVFASPGIAAIEYFPDVDTVQRREGITANAIDGVNVTEISIDMSPVRGDIAVCETVNGALTRGDGKYPVNIMGKHETSAPAFKVWSSCEKEQYRKTRPILELSDSSLQYFYPKSEPDLKLKHFQAFRQTEFEGNGKNGIHDTDDRLDRQEKYLSERINGQAMESRLGIDPDQKDMLRMFMYRYGAEGKSARSAKDGHAKDILESLSVSRRAFLVELNLYQDFLLGVLPLTSDLIQDRVTDEEAQCPECLRKAGELQDDLTSQGQNGPGSRVVFSTHSEYLGDNSSPGQDQCESHASKTGGAEGAAASEDSGTPAETLGPPGVGSSYRGQSESGSKSSVVSQEDIMLRSSDSRRLVDLKQRCSQGFHNSFRRASFERLKDRDPQMCLLLSLLFLVCVQLICWVPVTVLYLFYDVTGFPRRPTSQEMIFLCIWCARMAIQPFLYACYSKYFRQNYCQLLPCSF